MANKKPREIRPDDDEDNFSPFPGQPIFSSPIIPPDIRRQVNDPTSPRNVLLDKGRSLLIELANRSAESLAMYEPLPVVQKFHESRAQIRLVRGSNRSGKTLSSAIEIARAVTGQDPYNKYPIGDGRAFLVGKDGKHLADVMYRKLFRSRAFLMVRDLITGKWRAWRPWEPEDLLRSAETKPAPPLISRRFIKDIAWENKKASCPQIIRLTNGWELNFFSSLGKPPQGSDIDLAWLDEEIVDPDWVPEMQARILDRDGKIVWSATPQAGTEHLFDLHERAQDEAKEDDPQVEEFEVLLSDNKFMSDKAKKDFERNITNEDERLVRVGGQFAVSGFKVYPEYGDRHHVPWFQIPPDWCRYAFIDPGRQRCASLFIALPPDGRDKHVYAYDELYIKDCDARTFGRAFAAKVKDQVFQAFYIDFHEATKREAGSGLSIYHQYSMALKKNGVKSADTGCGFARSSDDVKGGIEAFRGWLVEDDDGDTRLRVFKDKCPNLDHELRRYHYKRVKQHGGFMLTTDEPIKRNDHLCDCCRYAASAGLFYVKPKSISKTINAILKYLAAKRARRRKGKGGPRVNLGPGEK